MPTAARSDATFVASSIGPAVEGLAGAARIHSVFPSVVNIEIAGSGIHVVLAGPSKVELPNAIVLDEGPDFSDWGRLASSPGLLSPSSLHLGGEEGPVIDIGKAPVRTARDLPRINYWGEAYAAAIDVLENFQARGECELRFSNLRTPICAVSRDSLAGLAGGKLVESVQALGSAVLHLSGGGPAEGFANSLDLPVASLVGLGQGLTPSGDDFLCGFLAALRCSATGNVLSAMHEAIEKNIHSTNGISASMLRCAIKGLFPSPLIDAALSLAMDDAGGAIRNTSLVCTHGHSSGADMASGFLYGIGLFEVSAR